MFRRIKEFFLLADFKASALVALIGAYVVVVIGLMIYWDYEPASLDVEILGMEKAAQFGQQPVVGTATTATLIGVVETMLGKRGGYLSNDMLPPGLLMDNVPSWEYGVVRQVRDLAESMRNDMSRSQTQSVEDPDLAIAAPQFQFPTDSWILPTTESQYREGIRAMERYLERLGDADQLDAQFYARADNLADWLAVVEKRLGDLGTRLAASVGDSRVNEDLAGDTSAMQSTPTPQEIVQRTPWLEIDNVFYEARGASWALLQFLRAAEVDFAAVLEDKNATASLQNVIRSLEPTQDQIWSPIILNGTGFGFTANHSLVMGSYISRANAALIQLRTLLSQG
ncbi:MAG: DUF2333 family protein [Pseudomonadota bacterium]